jgi:DNA-binding response OmpR family regulator
MGGFRCSAGSDGEAILWFAPIVSRFSQGALVEPIDRAGFKEDDVMLSEATKKGCCAKVLVIEDKQDNLALIEEILESDGYQVFCAKDGVLGLEMARTSRPDCVILDIQMPGLDGFEICRRLKVEGHTRDIPVLFLSAKYLDEESVVRGLDIGGQDYLLKPFNCAELLARVRVLVRIKRTDDTLRKAYDELRIAQEALLNSQRLETVRQVVATLTHELNQPLTAVLGNAEMLALDLSEPEHMESVGVIMREAARMSDIVQRLAEASRLDVVPYVPGVSMLSVRK